MRIRRFAPAALAFALPLGAACSSADGGPTIIADPRAAGEPQTGSGSATTTLPPPSPTAGTTPLPPTSGTVSSGGGSSPSPPPSPSPIFDAGTSSAGPEAGCANPSCAADGKKCGCAATDSQGNPVVLACADGACACLAGTHGELEGTAFAQNGACTSSATAAAQFTAYCACN